VYINRLHLKQFRNYIDQAIEFTSPKTIILGNNAQGKSNLLEAIQLLSTLRSPRVSRDRDLVKNGNDIGEIKAICQRSLSEVELVMRLRAEGRRSLALNGVGLSRHLEFLGQINTVCFSSLDLELVRGSPECRRDWLDNVLVQLEPVYLSFLQQYNQVLRQRNALLKGIRQGKLTNDPTQMAAWDAQLVATGTRITRRRSRLIQRLTPIAQTWHSRISSGNISGSSELLDICYTPKFLFKDTDSAESIQAAFLEQIQARAIAEYHQGTSLVGPHRDEVNLTINQTPAKEYGSQGQQRTLVLALKLAELELIESIIGEPPLLLLDDVLAELDLQRQNYLLSAIADRVQTIITSTHLSAFDGGWLDSAQILQVENGNVKFSQE
jgi:DNA replication and repair protein RecF